MALVKRNTVYSLNDIVNTKYGTKLKCTTAGTTSTDPLILDGTSPITDGTVVWEVQEESGGSGQGLVDYEANKNYSVGDIVIYSSKIYRCITAHTSTSTFDDTKWGKIGDEVFTGATSSLSGEEGIVPQPTTNDISKFLCGDGTWKSAGGSGLNIGRTLLWTGDITTTIPQTSPETLLDDYNNYDYLEFVSGYIQPGDTVSDGYSFSGSCFVEVEKVTDYYPSVPFEYLSTNNNIGHEHFNMDIEFIGNNQFFGNVFRYRQTNATTNCHLCLHKIYGIKLYNPNAYSTTEQEIGTWIDGKKLYQKTITGNLPTTVDTDTVVASISDLDTVVEFNGFGRDFVTGIFPFNYGQIRNTFASKDFIAANLDTSGDIYVTVSASSYLNQPFWLTVKYTKV